MSFNYAAPRPSWPYIMVGWILGTVGSSLFWYRFLTAPLPPGQSDETSPLFNMILWPLIIGSVCVCSFVTASAGWLIAYVVRRLFPSP